MASMPASGAPTSRRAQVAELFGLGREGHGRVVADRLIEIAREGLDKAREFEERRSTNANNPHREPTSSAD
jgi:hypothetical protein